MRKPALILSLLLLTTLVVVPATPAGADEVPKDATWHEVFFPSDDGTMLHADVFLPKDRRVTDQHPTILSIGPYFGTHALNGAGGTESGPVVDRFRDMIEGGNIFQRGYAYVQVDSRGFGSSDGCYDYGGEGEQMDAKSAVEWAAQQPWSNGKVGMWGKSYDAWTQVMALANKPSGLEAAVVQSPIDDRYNIAFMNGVHYDAGWYATPALYGVYDLAPSAGRDSPPEDVLYPALGTLTDPSCYILHPAQSNLTQNRNSPYWQEGEISGQARLSKVPTFWSFGFRDANTKPNNFMNTWEGYRGWHRGWFGQYDHVRGNEVEFVGRDGFLDEAMSFFDHFLAGKPLPEFPARVEVQDGEGKWRTESEWPPPDADYDRGSLKVKPGEYVDNGRNSASAGTGSWTFTQPAPYDIRFAGEAIIDVKVETTIPNANLITLLYDIDPDGNARMITEGASLIAEAGRVSYELYPQDWVLREGHRIGILLTSSDTEWFQTYPTGQTVTITGGKVELPFLKYLRRSNLDGKPATAMGDVPTTDVDKSEMKGREAKADWPPAMAPR